jgi:hypothetical protein
MVAVRDRREHAGVWTAADLLAMPHDLDHRYELVEGRLVTMAPTGGTHGRRTFDLAAALGAYAMQHGLGVVLGAETGFNLTRPGEAARPSSHPTWPLCVPQTRLLPRRTISPTSRRTSSRKLPRLATAGDAWPPRHDAGSTVVCDWCGWCGRAGGRLTCGGQAQRSPTH